MRRLGYGGHDYAMTADVIRFCRDIIATEETIARLDAGELSPFQKGKCAAALMVISRLEDTDDPD